MFLKSLEIRGFKSFADKTELKFKKGVTAVVGPNGSGKSNISDSVRWVLGEQSVKNLRGGKMEDVIFAGTQFRKAVGLAQVSLTLDNSDSSLSTDYNEVTVSRRIFRSGETEYLINNTKCRLKDITALFMDTGIGKDGYSLIGQGKIEAILSGKPEDRRSLLEEAAGIVKFKYRKDEAEKKLSNTDNNLVRIRDIISTYEERLEPLRLDREKALTYRTIAGELKEKEVSLLVHYIGEIESQLDLYKKELDEKEKSLNNNRTKLFDENEKMNALEIKIEELEKKTVAERNDYYSKKESIAQIYNEIELYKERIKNHIIIIEKNDKAIKELEEKIELLRSEKKVKEDELTLKRTAQKSKEDEIRELETNNSSSLKNINDLEEELKGLKEDEFELLRGNSEINNSITLINNDMKLKKERENTLNISIESIEGNVKINSKTLESLSLTINEYRNNIGVLEADISDKRKSIGILQIDFSKKENETRELNSLINKLEANKNMLTDLEKHYEGYNRSVKILMERIDKGITPNAEGTKVLGEILKINKIHETAVEIALGGGISNVITENEVIAKNLINYLKQNHLGRATFLPLNNIRGTKLQLDKNVTSTEGYIGLASEIVSYDIKYEKAVNNILGRTIVAKDMDSALAISRKGNTSFRIVTLTGEVITPGGALTGGSIQGKHTNILGRKREIEELGQTLETKKKLLVELQSNCMTIKDEIKKLDEEILNNKDEIHKENIEVTKQESEIIALKNESTKLKYSLEVSKGEIKRNIYDIEKLKQELVNKESELGNLEVQNDSNKFRTEEIENILNGEREKIDLLREKLTELRVDKAGLDEVLSNLISELNRKDREIKEAKLKVSDISSESLENNKEIESLNKDIIYRDEKIKVESAIVLELEEGFKIQDVQKEKYKQELKIHETIIHETRELIGKDEIELNKKEISKAKCEMEKESFYTKLNEELDLTLAEATDIAVEIENIGKYKEEVGNLKKEVTKLGVVNLAAIEEYEEVNEKYNFMSKEENDLEKAKGELVSVIGEMTDKMKEVFKENFTVLNKNFNETFKELFKGGSAQLILSEGDELTANIDINVEPPGKKLQNINLMSGGEKVLSAIALLFAILKMKPTPFCILDEIEAALDDANVYRYAEFLKEFSKNIQFIVITHRKGTMEASDLMYGVTMEEKGISKVVSVDLSK